VETLDSLEDRIRIIEVVEDFERNPQEFMKKYEKEQRELRERIVTARRCIHNVEASEKTLRFVSEICINAGVEGHRADILITRCAKTIAAFNGRKNVGKSDVVEAAELVLPHRVREDVFEPPEPVTERIKEALRSATEKKDEEENEEDGSESTHSRSPPMKHRTSGGAANEKVFPPVETSARPELNIRPDRRLRVGYGRRAKTLAYHSGRYVRFRIPAGAISDVAFDATVRAALLRKGSPQPEAEDIRQKIRQKKRKTAIAILVDASGSMGARRRIEFAKGVCLSLLEDAYQKRDRVAFIVFRGKTAQTILPFTNSISLAKQKLKSLPTGGRTPLAAGMLLSFRLLRQESTKDKNTIPLLVLISDGCANVPIRDGRLKEEIFELSEKMRRCGIRVFVLDASTGALDIGLCHKIAEVARGSYQSIRQLLKNKYQKF